MQFLVSQIVLKIVKKSFQIMNQVKADSFVYLG